MKKENTTNVYYVYVYLNPLKGGKYNYGNHSFKYEPFYVGFGKGGRYKDHIYTYKCTGKSHKNNVITKIMDLGKTPIIIKLKEGMSSTDGIKYEIETIKTIGRFDLKKGPLTNKTDGGDSTGYKHTEESLEKMRYHQQNFHAYKGRKRPDHSEFMKKNNPMFNTEHRKAQLKACNTKEHREACIKNSIGENNSFYGKKHTEQTIQTLRDINSIKIEQIDIKTLRVIKIFESIKVMGEELNIRSCISGCCRGTFLSRGGYYWEYHDKDLKEKYRLAVDKKRLNSRKIREIAQFDKNNHFLNIYRNATEASKETNTNQCNILKCCKGKQEYSNGFIWKYYEE